MHASDARGYIFELTASGKKRAVALVKEFDNIQDIFESAMGTKKSREFVDLIQSFIFEYERMLNKL